MSSISAGTQKSIIVMDYDGCGDSLVSVINLYNLIYNRDKYPDSVIKLQELVDKIQIICDSSHVVYFINGSIRINKCIDSLLSEKNNNGESLKTFPKMINNINNDKISFKQYFLNMLKKCKDFVNSKNIEKINEFMSIYEIYDKKDEIKNDIFKLIDRLKVNIDTKDKNGIDKTELDDFINNFVNQKFDDYNINLQKVKTALEKYKRALFILILEDMIKFNETKKIDYTNKKIESIKEILNSGHYENPLDNLDGVINQISYKENSDRNKIISNSNIQKYCGQKANEKVQLLLEFNIDFTELKKIL